MIKVVPARVDDADELASLLNTVIAKGGTTAHETPFAANVFAAAFLSGEDCISCVKAVAEDGSALGFQTLGFSAYVPGGWGDIGTFTRVGLTQGGVGTALFTETLRAARERDIPAIQAIIRADNVGGLAFYTKMGFVDYKVLKAVPLKDGTLVDRICKKLVL